MSEQEPKNILLESIQLNDSELYTFKDINGVDTNAELKNLSKINLFIGANNSGKSRFLRELVTTKDLRIRSQSLVEITNYIKSLNNLYEDLANSLHRSSGAQVRTPKIDLPRNHEIEDFEPKIDSILIDCIKNSEEIFLALKPDYDQFQRNRNQYINEKILTLVHDEFMLDKSGPGMFAGFTNDGTINQDLQLMVANIINEYANKTPIKLSSTLKTKKLYIPILRGLRPFQESESTNNSKNTFKNNPSENTNSSKNTPQNNPNDFYQSRTRQDYKIISDNGLEIFTGQTLYDSVKEMLLGLAQEREKVANFQKFLSETFFDCKEVTLIPNIQDDVLYIKIGTEDDRAIYNVGDGIQSIIILTFPLFMNQDENLLCFIEEPENHLHPAYQRVFIDTLLRAEFSNHQFFITTHSNHFLDLTLDHENMSVYSFNKSNKADIEGNPIFNIKNVSNSDRNPLQLLGVQNSSVFLSNCTIWVEGITDRKYLKYFLHLYLKEPKTDKLTEQLDYSFVEYSGNNITHWSFLDDSDEAMDAARLCGELFLIADHDGVEKGSTKFDRHKKLKKQLGENFLLLGCIEIENLLTPEVIKNIVGEYEKTQAVDTLFKDFSQSDYKMEHLGIFITEHLNEKPSRKGGYKAESGTIKEKGAFCSKALKIMDKQDITFKDLSPEAKKVTKKIYNFIVEHKQN